MFKFKPRNKYKVNGPTCPCEVTAINKTEAYIKLKAWLKNTFSFTIDDVYKVN
jgi:hypothetical protein